MILRGAAPCTSMVFVWSQLVKGDANYTLVQVSINDLIMVLAFALITALLLGVAEITIPWETLIISVVLYVILPLGTGYITRKKLNNSNNPERISEFTAHIKPLAILGLLATVTLLFALQATTIISNPKVIALIATPLILQSYGIFVI